MNLTEVKLKSLWGKEYFLKENRVTDRHDEVTKLVDLILNEENQVKISGDKVTIKGKELKFIQTINKKDKPTISAFGPAVDGLTDDKAFGGVKNIADRFFKKKLDEWKMVVNIGCLLGGFDFDSHKMIDGYRIVSNNSCSIKDFRGSLTSDGIWRHPSSNFADNNYFFHIMKFMQDAEDKEDKNKGEELWKNTIMVLRYPGKLCAEKVDNNEYPGIFKKHKEILYNRFSPKFLWMWANKETVIHPISLMAFRNFLDSEFGRKILEELQEELNNKNPQSITDEEFNIFIEDWLKISNKILETLGIGNKPENINNLSKLISSICVKEADIRNISDLLTTGDKAVILWGPPGTGKTFESKAVVKELLKVSEEDNLEGNYLFSKHYSKLRDKQESNEQVRESKEGYYEIIQFHPNYTYQDFIGGISPKLEKNNNIGYELREGVFKKFCDIAKKCPEQKFIFIIDEINRAELSAVFGELLYALEYRGQSINLPLFNKEFTIPENVYIIGTMNNVDKSLVTFDLALRRRFGFFKLMPKLEVIKDVLSEWVEKESLAKYYKKCNQLNKNIIEKLNLGEDYQIGQAYFLKIKNFIEVDKNEENEKKLVDITSFELEKLWIYHIEPLLEEYLGMSVEDDNIQNKIKELKKEFLQEE